MAESREVSEPTPFPEKTELTQSLLKIKTLEESQREKIKPPEQVILLGGGGVTGRRYGPLFVKAGLPVGAVVDITPIEKTSSLSVLSQTEYYQVTPDFSVKEIGKVLERLSNAALVVMTPQENHADILLKLGPLLAELGTPVWIDKPMAMSAEEATNIAQLINQYPKLAHQVVSGGYTLDKAIPELALLGLFGKSCPFIDSVKPADETSPDFKSTYLDNEEVRKKLGVLKNVRFLFIEGREDIREVIGKYGRTHLALYPGGGMTGDLLEHLTDKLFRLGILGPESEFLSVYLGYTPIGLAKTSFPWQVPKEKGLVETGGELIMFGKNHVPVLLNYGKRGPEFLGDVRRSRLTFEHGVLETNYTTTSQGQSNVFTIKFEGVTTHSYFIDVDPYVLMLKRYRELWSGDLQGQGGLYSQLCHAILIDDIYRIWQRREPILFKQSQKARQFRDHKHKDSEGYQKRQERDLQAIQKLMR